MIGIGFGAHRVICQSERGHVGVVARQRNRRIKRPRVGIDADAVAGPRRVGGADRVGREALRPGGIAAAARDRDVSERQLEVVCVCLDVTVGVGHGKRDGVDVGAGRLIGPPEAELVGTGAGDAGRVRGDSRGIPVVGGDARAADLGLENDRGGRVACWTTPGKSTTPSFTSNT